jgi:hypothetical protein
MKRGMQRRMEEANQMDKKCKWRGGGPTSRHRRGAARRTSEGRKMWHA